MERKGTPSTNYNTPLSARELLAYTQWKKKYVPLDSGEDYDLPGAFLSGQRVDQTKGEHGLDIWKKPNHPTFSEESQYSNYGIPGKWSGEIFVPSGGLLLDQLKNMIVGASMKKPSQLLATPNSPYLLNFLRNLGLTK